MRRNIGFSLIETLFALFIVTMGAVVGFAVISQAMHTSPTVRRQLIAANLAQETLELIRNIRDGQLLHIADKAKRSLALSYPADSWAQTLDVCPSSGYRKRLVLNDKNDLAKGWAFNNGCAAVSGSDRETIFQNPVTGFYANLCNSGGCVTGWNDSGFRQKIYMEKFSCQSGDPQCALPLISNNNCDNDNSCAEVRVRVKVYWNTNTEPDESACPSDICIIAEDRLRNWADYMQSFL